jgi:hypothetical protein
MLFSLNRKSKLWKILLALGLVVVLAAAWWATPRKWRHSHRYYEEIGFATVLSELSRTREAANGYVQQHGNLIGIEALERSHLPPQAPDRQYLVFSEGILVGISYEHQITAVFTPKIEDGSLRWRCRAFPEDVYILLCDPRLRFD